MGVGLFLRAEFLNKNQLRKSMETQTENFKPSISQCKRWFSIFRNRRLISKMERKEYSRWKEIRTKYVGTGFVSLADEAFLEVLVQDLPKRLTTETKKQQLLTA